MDSLFACEMRDSTAKGAACSKLVVWCPWCTLLRVKRVPALFLMSTPRFGLSLRLSQALTHLLFVEGMTIVRLAISLIYRLSHFAGFSPSFVQANVVQAVQKQTCLAFQYIFTFTPFFLNDCESATFFSVAVSQFSSCVTTSSFCQLKSCPATRQLRNDGGGGHLFSGCLAALAQATLLSCRLFSPVIQSVPDWQRGQSVASDRQLLRGTVCRQVEDTSVSLLSTFES